MITISAIRARLSAIPDVFYPIPPELADRGTKSGMKTVWSFEDSSSTEGLVDYRSGEREEADSAQTGPEPDELFEFAPDIEQTQLEGIMGGNEGDEIRRAVELHGVDALAWYIPFHVMGAQWGIYLSTTGILYLIEKVFRDIEAPLSVKLKMSVRALHQHELFHFATDYLASQYELLSGEPCHRPSRELRDEELGYMPEEERLANAHMIRSFWGRRIKGKTSALRHFVSCQGKGYSEGGEITDKTAFTLALSELGKIYAFAVPGFSGDVLETPELDASAFFPQFPIDWRYCPIHLVADHVRFDLPPDLLEFLSRISLISESARFEKSLQRAPTQIRKKWEALKNRLAHSVAGTGIDFKLWKWESEGTVYSVRLSRNYRAHLLHLDPVGEWLAIDLGTHRQMGHG